VLEKLKELDVVVVAADISDNFSTYSEAIKRDLARADGRATIPVNLIYPANYPDEPAILLEELVSPSEALEALSRVAGTSGLAVTTTMVEDSDGHLNDL
jgi:hypothetical protein